MSLPACEQRALKVIDDALRASEPRLAGMYTMFARLNAGEPVGAEVLSCSRLPRLRPAVFAMVLLPAMFMVIAIGALLSSGARGAGGCGMTQSAIRGGPLLSRTSCRPARTAPQAVTLEAKTPQTKAPGTADSPKRQVIRAADSAAEQRTAAGPPGCAADLVAGRPVATGPPGTC